MNDTTTNAERLLWLAGLEMDCPEVFDLRSKPGHPDSCYCHGTRKVPRFLTLRRECPTYYGTYLRRQGQGWVTVDTEGALLPCARGWMHEVKEYGSFWAACLLTPSSRWAATTAHTYMEAMTHALYLAVKAEEEKP